jgi:hypothetical protein
MHDVVTGHSAGLRIEIAPGLRPGSWTRFKLCDAQPSGLRFRLFSFAVNALSDASARCRLIAKNRFIGQYPRPKPGKESCGRFGAGDGNARDRQILDVQIFGGDGCGFCVCIRPCAAAADASFGPVQFRRHHPRRPPAAGLLLWRRVLPQSVIGLRHDPPRQESSERRFRCGGQDQGKRRHPAGSAEQQRRQRAATVICSGTVATRQLDAADQRGAWQRRPAGLLAVALIRRFIV